MNTLMERAFEVLLPGSVRSCLISVRGTERLTFSVAFENKDSERKRQSKVNKLFHRGNVIFLAPVLTKGCCFQSWARADISELCRWLQSISEKKRQPDDLIGLGNLKAICYKK